MSTTKCQIIVSQAIDELKKGDLQRARTLLQSAYEQGCGMFAGVHVGFGAIYEHNKEIDKALAAFDYAVKVDPLPAAYNNRGRMYYFIGDLKNALMDYQTTVQLQPDNPRGHFNIAGVYLERGKIEEALPYLHESARLGYPPAQQLLHEVQTQGRPPTETSQGQSRWELLPQEQRGLLNALILLSRFAYQMMGPYSILKSHQKQILFGLSTKNVLKEDIQWRTTIESLHEFDPQGYKGEINGATLEICANPSFLIRVTAPTVISYEVGIRSEFKHKDISRPAFRKEPHHTWIIQQGDLEEKLNSLMKDGIIKLIQQKLTYSP
jgi:tetratricopeptide (TPR) repeat protein